MNKQIVMIVFVSILFGVKLARADEIIMYLDQVPSAEELAGALFPEEVSDQPPMIKTRSLQFGKKVKTSDATGVGMPIQFDYNSADIKPDSMPYLDQIGKMMKMEKLAHEKIMVEGHTDASGSAQYNKRLSEKRALAVKDYLVGKYNITSRRILISGKGESSSLPGRKPTDPLNRRVQFYRGK